MKIFFDTEFIEDGKTIDLLSIGAIREDGAVFYAESEEADHAKACEWVRANVLPHLLGGVARHSRKAIADTFRVFCGPQPEFWAYYSDYDWVALCQLYGRMVELPDSWPMFCRDVKQLCIDRGNPELPPREGTEHHALQDARWARDAWKFLSARPEALDKNTVLEQAARACEKLAERRFEEHGFREPDTNATYYGGHAAEEYDTRDEEDADCAAAVRALKTIPSPLARSQEKP